MKYKILTPLLLSLSLLLSSCGGGGGSSTYTDPGRFVNTETFSLAEKEFVHDLFLTEYLWYDEVSSNVDTASYDTPQALINALKVPQDLWSFSLTQTEYENMVNQKTAGFGFGYIEDFTIFLVRIDAPAWGKLQRGDKIIEINGEAVTNENIASASANLNVATTFTVRRIGEGEKDIVITPQEYNFKVTQGNVFTHNNKNIGYLRYDSFTDNSYEEIKIAFSNFSTQGVNELVVDLRYNGGGSVTAASSLIEKISNSHEGEVQFYLAWNKNFTKNNVYTHFDEKESMDLNMHRVIFLVTENSASASELVISALQPYLNEVVTIGTNTHGKNVGMSGKKYENNIYFLINFYVKNSLNVISSKYGIEPTCSAEDDLNHLRGDPDETMLKNALHYIDTGLCL